MFRAVEQLEPVIVAVVQKSIEFALCYLEKSIFNRDDLSLQVCIFFFLLSIFLLGEYSPCYSGYIICA